MDVSLGLCGCTWPFPGGRRLGREVLSLHRAWSILGCLQRRENQWCPKAAFLLPPTSPAWLQLVRSRDGGSRELG